MNQKSWWFNAPLGASLLAALVALLATGCAAPAPAPPSTVSPPTNSELILATTTSTRDSGLLDVLIPEFEKATGYKVKPIAVGSGQAMTLGERGEADVLLVHAPDSEVRFMQAGHGVNRRLVMHNDFVIVGPAADPAGLKQHFVVHPEGVHHEWVTQWNQKSAVESLRAIASAKALFISRGDNSGTHQLESKVMKMAGIDPRGQAWYQESGQGMGATLNIASEKGGYTITDRATYLAIKKNLSLELLVEGDPILLNIYHVIQVNPEKSDRINAAGAKAFAEFMVAPDTQKTIGSFGAGKFGQPLFFPDAGKTEAELGSV